MKNIYVFARQFYSRSNLRLFRGLPRRAKALLAMTDLMVNYG